MPYNFYSIATSISQREQLPSHKWWHHNKYVARMLGVSEEELDVFVLQCEKGYSNTKERDTAVKNPAPFDLPIKLKDRSSCNVLRLHYEAFGRKGSADVRHFSFGNIEAPRDHTKRTISF